MSNQIIGRVIIKRPLFVIEMSGRKGDTFVTEQVEDAPRSSIAEVMMFVHGEVSNQRISGTPTGDGSAFVWKERMTTRDRTGIADIAPAGKFKFEVLSDTAMYYCVRRTDRLLMDYTIWRPEQGDVLELAKGESIFLAQGSVVFGGKEAYGPHLVQAISGNAQLQADSVNVFALYIKGL